MMENAIFTDESTFFVENVSAFTFRKQNEQSKKRGKPKHPTKVNVWGVVSRRGATELLIFDGIMRKEFFVQEILDNTFLPFAQEHYADDYRLVMDNDPKHSSRASRDFLEQENVNWFKTPAESPDMNPIEHIWHQLKYYLRNVSS